LPARANTYSAECYLIHKIHNSLHIAGKGNQKIFTHKQWPKT
jgi:hypothetical protein